MRSYRFAWWVAAGIAATPALVFEVLDGGLWRMVLLGAVFAVFTGLLVIVLAEEHPDRWAWTRRGALWAGLGVPVADALVMVWGSLGAFAIVLLVLTCPAVIEPARAWLAQLTSRRTSGPPESLSTRDLLRRWEWTTAEVRSSRTSVSRRLVLVDERRRLLDELEQRDPAHFDAWVATAVPDDGSLRRRRGR